MSIKDKTPRYKGLSWGSWKRRPKKKNDGPISCTDAGTSHVTAKATYISYEEQIEKPLN
jgi:hypothetical protein